MSRIALSAALISLATAGFVASQATATFPATPLISQIFPHPTDAPQQVYPDPTFIRGPQSGYNRCNSTTETQDSMCQTSFVNGLDDFCLWAPPQANTSIADSEGEEVAWCSKKGHGTRIMLSDTIQGAQLLKAPDYWMITGLIDQTKLNIQNGDSGGELDSGGQDTAGNPIGGLLYSTAFSTDGQPDQILTWTEFIGSNQFCIKICPKTANNPTGYCQHTLDRIGLGFNCPSKYTVGEGFQAGEFEVCESADMTVPGVYVDGNGVTQSYSQPAESLGPITSVPYSPSAAASSNCVTSASTALFTDAVAASPTPSGSASGSNSVPTGASQSGKGSSSGAPTRTGSSGSTSVSPTGANQNSGAGAIQMSMAATLVATLFAAAFLA